MAPENVETAGSFYRPGDPSGLLATDQLRLVGKERGLRGGDLQFPSRKQGLAAAGLSL